jgi:hypothetical protein
VTYSARATIDAVRAFACPVCDSFAPFESRRCPTCQAELGLHVPTLSMIATSEGSAVIDGSRWIHCTKSASLGCNWLVPEAQEKAHRGRCFADSLIRAEPHADDTIAQEKLADTTTAMHRLILQLLDLGLPIEPFWRTDGGLAFDLLSSYSEGKPVTIGHANGVITIDLVESLDAYGESLRVRLGEPYRTMLGHFRHEVGHYYQHVLVETGAGAVRYLDDCRELFGDERADYQAEIARHYKLGPPEAGPNRSSPSTPPCIRGRTSRNASRTTSTSPTPSTPSARRAWSCTPIRCGSRFRGTSPRWREL